IVTELIADAAPAAAVGCGGGGGVGDQFCHDWAAASCHRIWLCPDPFGPSEAACTQGFTKLCTDPQPAGQTSDVSCVGATHVNEAAKSLCLSEINAETCDDLNSGNVVTVCDQ